MKGSHAQISVGGTSSSHFQGPDACTGHSQVSLNLEPRKKNLPESPKFLIVATKNKNYGCV